MVGEEPQNKVILFEVVTTHAISRSSVVMASFFVRTLIFKMQMGVDLDHMSHNQLPHIKLKYSCAIPDSPYAFLNRI